MVIRDHMLIRATRVWLPKSYYVNRQRFLKELFTDQTVNVYNQDFYVQIRVQG